MVDKGIQQLTTDSGTQFTSRAFKQFCDGWGINHMVSSPHHHQANGAAEAAVKAVKTLLSKNTANGNININAFRAGLLKFRSTSRTNCFRPSRLLFGRPLCSQVLAHPSAFKQEWRDLGNTIDQAASSLGAKARKRHDQHVKPLPVLTHGTIVRVQHPRSKRSGYSYGVKAESGRVLWCNRNFLRLFYPHRFDFDIYFSSSVFFVVFFLLSGSVPQLQTPECGMCENDSHLKHNGCRPETCCAFASSTSSLSGKAMRVAC